MAEDAEMQAAPAIVSERMGGDAMYLTEEIDRALLQALACREVRNAVSRPLKLTAEGE